MGFWDSLTNKIGDRNLDSDMRVALADGIYQILKDNERTRTWLQDVTQPELRTDAISSDAGLNPFLQRFWLNRLLHPLGDQRSPSEIVPDSEDPSHQEIVEFERAICVIVHIWAEAWCNQPYRPAYPANTCEDRCEKDRGRDINYICEGIRCIPYCRLGCVISILFSYSHTICNLNSRVYVLFISIYTP